MELLHELHCDDGGFAGWTEIIKQPPSIIEQVPAAAHNGAAGNRIVINETGKIAYAGLENWATPMAMGELRAIGCWWKVVVPVAIGSETVVAVPSIDFRYSALLWVDADGAVSVWSFHDGGCNLSDYVPLFTGTEWHHVRLVVIRHATAGGAQLWDGNDLLIDNAKYDTTNTYDGTPDWLHAGCFSAIPASFETYQDEFRIATTLQEAKPRRPIPPPLLLESGKVIV